MTTMPSPAEWDQDEPVLGHAAFRSRAPRVQMPAAQHFFSSVIFAAEMCDRQGYPVTVDTILMLNPELPKLAVVDLLTTDKFQRALEERGIRLPTQSGLTPEQLAAAAIYMDMTTPMTHRQKLRAAGVTDAKWKGWMRQPRFAEYISVISEDALRAALPVATQRLAGHVDDGNMAAIQLVYEMTGRHDRRKDNIDVNRLLLGIFTILDEEIAPLEGGVGVLNRINAKVKQMMGAGQAPVLQISPAPLPPPAD